MNLLPKTHEEFGKAEYWETFFKKRGEKAFEWYGEYLQLCEHLHKYIRSYDNVLVVGCGNSKLSMDLYDSGFINMTNIDISGTVIKKMLEQNKKKRPIMKFIKMDATEMDFADGEFSVVLDKGTLDALMTDDSEQVKGTVEKYFKEILRVLRNGGRYLCISLLQEHILKFVTQSFPSHNCMLRIVRCFEAEQANSEGASDGITMPVFMVIITKFQALTQKVLEINLGGDKMQRIETVEEIIEAITSIQNAVFVCNGLGKSSIAGHDEVVISLYAPGSNEPRYTVYILDQPPSRDNGKYAAFIVPQGREIEWLFSTPKGRKKLLTSSHQNRLAVVTFHRGQKYSSWDDVKNELSESIRNFAPRGISGQIPYLSLGADVGEREIIERGYSDISGEYIIEEIKGSDGKLYRRLIFLSNQFVIQSEALIKTGKGKGKAKSIKKTVDPSYLACQHHLYMTIGVNLVTMNNDKKGVVVIGLGGGGLCTFLHQLLRNTRIIAVDIDPAMLHVAKTYFGLKEDRRLYVEIEDGLAFMESHLKIASKFDVILFDVDSKDSSLGMSCPPKSFLEPNVLATVNSLLDKDGLFILNLVCRDDNLRDDVVKELKNVFKSVCCYKLEEDVNEIIYCQNSKVHKNLGDWKHDMEVSAKSLNHSIKKLKFSKKDLCDVDDFVKDLKA